VAFRGDEDAQRAKIEALERELTSAKKEHQQVSAEERAQEQKRDALAARVEELEASLKQARDPTAEPEPAPQPVKPVPPPAPSRPLWSRISEILGNLAWIIPLTVGCYCAIQDCRPSCDLIDDHVELEWTGHVTASSGVNIPADTPCGIRMKVYEERDLDTVGHTGPAEMSISCGGRPLFEGEGSGCQLEQHRGERGWSYFMSSCSFQGDEGSASWQQGSLTVDRNGQVTMLMDGLATSADALYAPEDVDRMLAERIEIAGVVVAVSGEAPVARGDRCTIAVDGTRYEGDINCALSITCGERLLRQERMTCDIRRERFVGARANGLWVDVGAGRASVEETGAGLPYRANIQLAR
jgi:hypothetical protein